jgi:hypothetical protein
MHFFAQGLASMELHFASSFTQPLHAHAKPTNILLCGAGEDDVNDAILDSIATIGNNTWSNYGLYLEAFWMDPITSNIYRQRDR